MWEFPTDLEFYQRVGYADAGHDRHGPHQELSARKDRVKVIAVFTDDDVLSRELTGKIGVAASFRTSADDLTLMGIIARLMRGNDPQPCD